MSFVPSANVPEIEYEPVWWFVFQDDQLMLLNKDNQLSIPKWVDLDEKNLTPVRKQYIGTLNGTHCFSAELAMGTLWPEGIQFSGLRQVLGVLDEDMLKAAIYAQQIVAWDQTFQFCGRCGSNTKTQLNERAKKCPVCGLVSFPRISPAIMVTILKNDTILLANNRMFPSNFYSVLAGFVEPGETLEECIRREVKEEVDIEIKNIKYFGSQPWPFPNSLMIAFTAEYKSGDIKVDGTELAHADWYTSSNLPKRPTGNLSIAGMMIDWFEKNY